MEQSKYMVFDDIQRNNAGPKLNRENEFVFLNRSADPAIAPVRDLIESCIVEYPNGERDELIQRIRCGKDNHFKSAFFEMVLHSMLIKLKCTLYPHPKLKNDSNARPDFYVNTPDGHNFYLEAVLASQIMGISRSEAARKGIAKDFLFEAIHPNFQVSVFEEGKPNSQPSGKALLRGVLTWLDSLDPDDVQAQFNRNGSNSLPNKDWEHDGWKLRLIAVPLDPENRNKEKKLISDYGHEARLADMSSPIKKAIKSKGSKYGKLEAPLLIAVNMDAFYLSERHEMQALFGQEQYHLTPGQPDKKPEFVRAPNGAWRGKNGPQYTRVSGMWIFNDLNPYSIAKRKSTIYFNPWATFKLPEFLRTFPHGYAKGDRIIWKEGLSIRKIFDLTPGWPL